MKRGNRYLNRRHGHSTDLTEWEGDNTSSQSRRKKKAVDESTREKAGIGTVVGLSRGRCSVALGDELIEALLSPELLKTQQTELAIGDQVEIERLGEGVLRVAKVLPRHGVLSRPDPHYKERERVIAANIDIVVNVVTLVKPPLRPRLIDRYLAAARRGGCELVVAVNKIDLCIPEEIELGREELAPYAALGAKIIECSAKTGEGLSELRTAIEGTTSVLSGHSGVGKTSIINAMLPKLKLKTNTLAKFSHMGKHTTTASTLYRLDDATSIIDTPGIREFGLWKFDRQTLAEAFADLMEGAPPCRFNDCTHSHEPDCGVRDAVEEESITELRYGSYLRLLEEISGGESER